MDHTDYFDDSLQITTNAGFELCSSGFNKNFIDESTLTAKEHNNVNNINDIKLCPNLPHPALSSSTEGEQDHPETSMSEISILDFFYQEHSCNFCGQIFNDKFILAQHYLEMHTSRLFQCSQCEKAFKELRTLRLHLKIHNAEYPEQCTVCRKVFRTKWQLKQHLMDHGGERPYPCPECPFTCKTKQQLNEHRRKHSGEKAYSCLQCGTRFTYRNGLIKHTKLNRCPKKIITAEGQTIIKKRSRNHRCPDEEDVSILDTMHGGSPQKKKPTNLKFSSPKEPVHFSPKKSSACLGYGTIDRSQNSSSMSDKSFSIEGSARTSKLQSSFPEQICSSNLIQKSTTPTVSSPNKVNNKLFGGGNISFNLALLDDGTMVATRNNSPSTISSEEVLTSTINSSGILPPDTILELSAATGLPSSEICSWAASLPAGSTIKVTHHYSAWPSTSKPSKQPITNDDTPSVAMLTELQHPLPPTDFHVPHKPTADPDITKPTLVGRLNSVLDSATMDFTSYTESFGVNPHDILKCNDNNITKRSANMSAIKIEEHNERIVSHHLSIKTDPIIKTEPVSPINTMRADAPPNGDYLPPPDIDFDIPELLLEASSNYVSYNNHHADSDHFGNGLNLNDQDFNSMKYLIDHAFMNDINNVNKDENLLDIVSAV